MLVTGLFWHFFRYFNSKIQENQVPKRKIFIKNKYRSVMLYKYIQILQKNLKDKQDIFPLVHIDTQHNIPMSPGRKPCNKQLNSQITIFTPQTVGSSGINNLYVHIRLGHQFPFLGFGQGTRKQRDPGHILMHEQVIVNFLGP